MLKKIQYYAMTFGCDPEFFFRKGKEIVGSDKILPLSGLDLGHSKIIIDGVQAELNPAAATCREVLSMNIGASFVALKAHLKEFKRISIDFAQTIKLSDEDFERLSDGSKKFGCMPSKNSNNGGEPGFIKVNPATYRFRSAGGHIHMGSGGSPTVDKVLKSDPVRMVKMLDILVGNTCVLLDRSVGNVERRKVYGMAGEFRTPTHGLEYRTLSNFWLRSYQLMSLVMGLTRHAVMIVANDLDGEFHKKVDMADITKAINTNNFSLAHRNFKKIEKLLLEITPSDWNGVVPIDSTVIKEFRHFVKKGMDHWFTEDPVEHWVAHHAKRGLGFFDFLSQTVRADMEEEFVREEELVA